MKHLKTYSFCLILFTSRHLLADAFIQKHVEEGKTYNQSMYEVYLAKKYQGSCIDEKELSTLIRCRFIRGDLNKQKQSLLNREITKNITLGMNYSELIEIKSKFSHLLSQGELGLLKARIQELEYAGVR